MSEDTQKLIYIILFTLAFALTWAPSKPSQMSPKLFKIWFALVSIIWATLIVIMCI